MMRNARAGLVLIPALFTFGCFEIHESIDLDKDLRGGVRLNMTKDFEPFVAVMAQVMAHFQRQTGGKSEPAIQAEIEKLRAEFRSKLTTDEKAKSFAARRPEVEKALPEGVKLLDRLVSASEMKVTEGLLFAFDKLSQLAEVKLPSAQQQTDPTTKNFVESPFAGLELIETKDTITIRSKPVNPSESVKKEASQSQPGGVRPELEQMMRDALKGLHVSYRITAPFAIVEHNATRRDGNTLTWEWGMESIEAVAKAGKTDSEMKVVYRR